MGKFKNKDILMNYWFKIQNNPVILTMIHYLQKWYCKQELKIVVKYMELLEKLI